MSVPSRRECQTIKVVIHGTSKASVYLSSSIDTRGASPRLQEIFCSVEKTGSDERAYMDTIARLVSRLLRYEPVEEVASCLEGVVTTIRGPVTSPNKVKFCMGFIDLLSKELVALQEELLDAKQ